MKVREREAALAGIEQNLRRRNGNNVRRPSGKSSTDDGRKTFRSNAVRILRLGRNLRPPNKSVRRYSVRLKRILRRKFFS